MTNTEKEAINELRIRGYGYGTIAKKLNLNMETVKSYCRRHRLSGKPEDMPLYVYQDTHCKNCGATITQNPNRKQKLFCCDKCRNQWWNKHIYLVDKRAWHEYVCLNCGKKFQAYGNNKRKYCCHECYIEDRFG